MSRIWIYPLVAILLAGCGSISGMTEGEREIRQIKDSMSGVQREQHKDMQQVSPIQVHQDLFLGNQRLKLMDKRNLPGIFSKRIVLSSNPESLSQAANRISEIAGISVQLSPRLRFVGKGSKKGRSDFGGGMPIQYMGNLKNLLDNITSYYGAHWEWLDNRVLIYRLKTKTYDIVAVPGKIKQVNEISNQSSGSSEGSSGNDQDTSNTQETDYEYEINIWEKLVENIKSILSADGKVMADQSSGTITITDTPQVQVDVEQYINQINSKLARQVAISVKVFSFTLNDIQDYGFSLRAMFENSGLAAQGVSLENLNIPSPTGLLSAVILDEPASDREWGGSQALVKALNDKGNVQLITSGSGIVMNNQPLPIQNINQRGYLKSSSIVQGETATTTTLESDTITTGFSLSATPHILANNRVVLQYNITLSNLEDMKTITAGQSKIQTPETSSRNFMQQVQMEMGETLFLAGFQKKATDIGTRQTAKGLLGWERKNSSERSMILVSITVNEVST